MKDTHLTKTRFSNLELSDSILQGLNDAAFNHCTPIQDKALPLLLRSKDIAGQAQTGTGKTATFLLATFQHLINDDDCKDVVGTTPGMEEVEKRRERLPEVRRLKIPEPLFSRQHAN